MKRLLILVTSALFLLGSTLSAQPQNGAAGRPGAKFNRQAGGFGGNNMTRIERMEKILNLTDDQKAKISELRFEQQNLILDTKNQIAKNRLIVRKMMTDNNVDQDKLLAITKENSELNGKLRTSKVKNWLEIYNILDNTQKEQWTKAFNNFSRNGAFGKSGRSGRQGKSGRGMNTPYNRMPQHGMGMRY